MIDTRPSDKYRVSSQAVLLRCLNELQLKTQPANIKQAVWQLIHSILFQKPKTGNFKGDAHVLLELAMTGNTDHCNYLLWVPIITTAHIINNQLSNNVLHI